MVLVKRELPAKLRTGLEVELSGRHCVNKGELCD